MKSSPLLVIFLLFQFAILGQADDSSSGPTQTRITVTIDRGRDLGQSFGSLFEVTSGDGSVVVGADFRFA